MIKFKEEIDFENFNENQSSFLVRKFKSETVDIIKTTDKLIEFRVPLMRFVWNWNVMTPVDRGEIRISQTNRTNVVTYSVSFLRFNVIAIVLSLFMGLIPEDLTFLLLCLFFFVGLNMSIAWLRQKSFFNDLINELKSQTNNN